MQAVYCTVSYIMSIKSDGADSVNTAIFISYFLHFLFKREKVVVAYCRFKDN